MKRPFVIAVIIILAVAWGLWMSCNRDALSSNGQSNRQPALPQNSSSNLGSVPAASQPPPPVKTSDDDVRREAARQKNVPIHFWGKVVDQDGLPLAGVSVTLTARQWGLAVTPLLQPTFKKVIHISDHDGLFQVINEKGDVLTVEALKKEGYTASPLALRSFGYNISTNITPEASNPVLFKMWKKGPAQPVVTRHFPNTGIPCDGTAISFDLITGEKGTHAKDLIVRFFRDPLTLTSRTEKFDWTFTLEMPEGGLIETNEEFMLLAPESGYQPFFRIEVPKQSPNWKKTLSKQFYVMLRGGDVFGSLSIQLFAYYPTPPTGLTVSVTINPTGNRSLER